MSAGELIPTEGLNFMDMAPVIIGSSRMGNSGQSVIGRTGPTRWRLQVTTTKLDMYEARIWDSWLANRIDLGETFTAWRLFRLTPQAALGNADGALTISVDAPNSRITLGGVGAYVATKGDMISYRTTTGGYYLGMVQGAVVASGGNATNIPMLPRPLPAHGTPAVRRVQALGEFELSTPLPPFEDYTNRSISFEAMQVLR